MPNPAVTEEDIARLVPRFYGRVRADPVLGPVFDAAIEDWPLHLKRLEAFWSSVVLTSGRYKGQPMAAHLRHSEHMTEANFRRWLSLWTEVAEEVLGTEGAAVFRDKAGRIAESLQLGVALHSRRTAATGAFSGSPIAVRRPPVDYPPTPP